MSTDTAISSSQPQAQAQPQAQPQPQPQQAKRPAEHPPPGSPVHKKRKTSDDQLLPSRPFTNWAKHSTIFHDFKTFSHGVLVTYKTCRASNAVGEITTVLHQTAVKLFGNEEKKRFQVCNSGADGLVVVRFLDPNMDPVAVVKDIFTTVQSNPQAYTKACYRILPVQRFVLADMRSITEAALPLIQKYFTHPPMKFSIVAECRNNETCTRDLIIKELAPLVPPQYSVDLVHPNISILVEVFKSACAISVVHNFYQWRKFNIIEIAKLQAAAMPALL